MALMLSLDVSVWTMARPGTEEMMTEFTESSLLGAVGTLNVNELNVRSE